MGAIFFQILKNKQNSNQLKNGHECEEGFLNKGNNRNKNIHVNIYYKIYTTKTYKIHPCQALVPYHLCEATEESLEIQATLKFPY